ncbi:hypothetical protein EYF80_041108 [Liparis tanakae]|uniref:Uncharacterized protein n=1 Tax=Liparis tanakae TaxID=230148 RepID=A0A4Z2G6B7_9TELE|nr:hypothetical protein EYF80_041108 [Liparis tanakae]
MGRRGVEVRTAESREKEREGAAAGRLTGRQVKTQHLRLVKEKIHMAEEAGTISHAPAVSQSCDKRDENDFVASGVNVPILRKMRNSNAGSLVGRGGGAALM